MPADCAPLSKIKENADEPATRWRALSWFWRRFEASRKTRHFDAALSGTLMRSKRSHFQQHANGRDVENGAGAHTGAGNHGFRNHTHHHSGHRAARWLQ